MMYPPVEEVDEGKDEEDEEEDVLHDVLPVSSWYVPEERHDLHDTLPDSFWYIPVEHAEHVAVPLETCSAGPLLPRGQAVPMQDVEPLELVKVPGRHGQQVAPLADVWDAGPYRPATHAVPLHVFCPVWVLYRPELQGSHDVLSASSWYLPAEQLRQASEVEELVCLPGRHDSDDAEEEQMQASVVVHDPVLPARPWNLSCPPSK